jgi:hypothetical protein
MPEYIKTNRPGYDLDDAIERSSPENAVIIKYEGGLRKEYIEYNALTQHMYNPKIDQRYFRRKKIVMRAGEEVMDKETPANMLTAGVNPFIQIIYKIVKRGGVTSYEDVVRALLNEERVFPSEDETSIEIIEKIIEYMNEGEKGEGGDYYLLLHKGKLKVGFDLPKSYHLVEYKRGYDPFEYHIMDLAEGRGLIKRSEIYQYITEYLEWMKSLEKVDMYIQRLIDKGNLKKVQDNYFRFLKPLESYN